MFISGTANVIDDFDHYLGWVIQPMNWEGTLWYVYERDDTVKPKGFLIRGSQLEAMSFIENRVKHS